MGTGPGILLETFSVEGPHCEILVLFMVTNMSQVCQKGKAHSLSSHSHRTRLGERQRNLQILVGSIWIDYLELSLSDTFMLMFFSFYPKTCFEENTDFFPLRNL